MRNNSKKTWVVIQNLVALSGTVTAASFVIPSFTNTGGNLDSKAVARMPTITSSLPLESWTKYIGKRLIAVISMPLP